MRNKIIAMGSIAAALMIMFAVTLATGGLNIAPQPDVLAQPPVTDMPKVKEEPMVWCTEKGNYYHFNEHCSGMEGAKHRPLSEAQEMGKNICPVCGPSEYDGQAGKEPIEFIYYSEDSQYFHKNQTCAGETYPLKAEALNSFFAATDAAVNKAPCPVCIPYGITMIGDGAYVNLHKTPEITPAEPDPKAELLAEATVFCTEGGSYYHSYADCSGMRNASAISLSEAIEMGKETCPRCLGPAFVFTTPHGEYYHSEKDCSGMEGATAMNPEEALWWDKHPCPVCITNKEVHVASSDMYYHESDSCSAAEFYYDKYPLLDALTIGMTPCPECAAVEVSPEEENQDAFWAEAEAEQEKRVYAAYGKPLYYHKADVCNGQQNNRSLTRANAEKEQLIPCPVCMKATPENYDLFITAFGQEIEDLYPGYIYECTNHGFEWIFSNGEESLSLCDVHPQGTAFFGEELPGFPELHMANLPAEQVHAFMEAAPAPIGSMYAAAPVEMEKALIHSKLTAEELQLQEIIVYFNAFRQVHACEMQFGFGDHVKLAWKVGTDGQIELTESEFVKPGWNDSSGEATQKAADKAIVTGTPSPVEFKTLSSPTLPDTLYQAAFGNLEKALDLGYGFYSKDSSHLDFSFVPKEENRYTLFGGGQIVLTLDWQENANASPLKYTMNVQLDGTREGGKRFMESVSAQPIASLYPHAVRLAREHLASIHKKDAESYDPYVVLLLMGFDEAKQLCALQMDFRSDEETFGIEYIPTDDSLSSWKSRIIV